jgi:hypothetical protein
MNRLTTKKTSTKKKSKKFCRIDEFELNDGDLQEQTHNLIKSLHESGLGYHKTLK